MNGGSPPPILRLPPDLRDQIAAGEVVERPSSVVKELVENALDAGARTIRIEIDGGGLERILVVDDGHGMTAENALLALERHATSKLTAFDDLYRLSTFGFRGEALPSIAAVSKLRLTTRTVDALAATQVDAVAGAPPSVREVGAPAGTSIEARSLFFNVPPRRKFLKSVATEAAHVTEATLELALARPDLALTLVRDGRIVRQYLRAPTREARGRDALHRPGAEPTEETFARVTGERGDIRVEALLSPPERARSGATGLHLLVNGRAVRDRILARAITMAYGSVIDPGRYPIGIVWLDLPPEEVDVNVHPQKAEVRFARGRELYDDVTRALAAALADAFRAPPSASFLDSRGAYDLFPPPRENAKTLVDEAPPTMIGHAVADLSNAMARAISPRADSAARIPVQRAADAEDPWGLGPSDPPAPTRQYDRPNEPSKQAESSPPNAPIHPRNQQHTLSTTLVSPDAALAQKLAAASRGEVRYGNLRFIAQVRATYLICEGDEGIFVIDQHAAAERVNFARLRDSHRARTVARQQLLVPDVVAVASHESALVDELREDLLALGVDARAIGDGRVAVHAVPALLPRARPETLLRDLLDELARSGERRFGDAVDLVLATMACHGSVRAGDTMHPDECVALLKSLDAIDFAGYCPHGRPIVTALSYAELEKKVGRR